MSKAGVSQRLKGLKSRKAKLASDLDLSLDDLREVHETIGRLKKGIAALSKEMNSLVVKDPVVSEHAILRFIERHLDYDIETIKSLILSEDVLTCIDKFGNGKYPISGTSKAVVRDRVVVTVEI